MIGIEIDIGNGYEVKEGNVVGVLKMMIIIVVVGIMIGMNIKIIYNILLLIFLL